MVRMLAAIALSLSMPVDSYRLASHAFTKQVQADPPTCACSETGVVDGVNTNHAGCEQHFGQRFGYICYVADGSQCEGARLSSRTGVYWRSCRAEHLTEEGRQYVLEAMEELDVDALRTTIEIARERGVDEETLAAAEARVLQEIEMVTARDELMEALQAFDADRLRAALEAAEELELDEYLSDETMESSVARFEFLQARQESEEALRAAIRETNLPDLQIKLRTAQTHHASQEAIGLAQDRVRELTRLMAAATEELEAALLTRDAARITESETNAQRLHAIDSSAIQQVEDRLEHLTLMEEATEELRPAIEGLSLRSLQSKLASARALDAYPDVLNQGDARAAELTQMNADALQALVDSTAAHDAAALLAAIANAETLDTAGDHSDTMTSANTRLEALGRKDLARARLEAAIETVDLEDVQAKLVWAEDVGVDAAVLDRARQRISEIAQMRIDARSALERAINGDELTVLDDAFAEAQRLSAVDAALTVSANERLAELTARQDAKDDLLAAVEGLDRQDLEAKITVARDNNVDQPTLHQAATRSRELESMMQRAERHLRRDIEGDDYEALRDSLAEAVSYNGAATAAQVQQGQDRLGQLQEIYNREQDLINAFDSVSMGHLQNKLRLCRDVGCHSQVQADGEAAASALRNRMAAAERNLIQLTETGEDPQQLREAIAEARSMNAAAHYRFDAAEDKLRELER